MPLEKAALWSSGRVDWETPPDLFAALDAEFGFQLDAAASHENAKLPRYYTALEDGLKQPWAPYITFVNPPYGRGLAHWVAKAHTESRLGATVVMLIPSRTDTRWFHDYILNRAEVRFLKGRLRFSIGGKLDNAPFPSMVVIFRPRPYDPAPCEVCVDSCEIPFGKPCYR